MGLHQWGERPVDTSAVTGILPAIVTAQITADATATLHTYAVPLGLGARLEWRLLGRHRRAGPALGQLFALQIVALVRRDSARSTCDIVSSVLTDQSDQLEEYRISPAETNGSSLVGLDAWLDVSAGSVLCKARGPSAAAGDDILTQPISLTSYLTTYPIL